MTRSVCLGKIFIFFLSFFSSSVLANTNSVEDNTSKRIKGVASFLINRANDNFMYLLEKRIRDNDYLSYYFPHTYKYIATGDFLSLLRSKRQVWENSVENDIRSISNIILEKISYEIKHRAADFNSKQTNIVKNLYIKVGDKYIKAFSTHAQNFETTSYKALHGLHESITKNEANKTNKTNKTNNDSKPCTESNNYSSVPSIRHFDSKSHLEKLRKELEKLTISGGTKDSKTQKASCDITNNKNNHNGTISCKNYNILMNNITVLLDELNNKKTKINHQIEKKAIYLEKIINKYTRLDRTLCEVNNIQNEHDDLIDIIRQVDTKLKYSKHPSTDLPVRFYFCQSISKKPNEHCTQKVISSSAKELGRDINLIAAEKELDKIIQFLQQYKNLGAYLDFVKKELENLENSNSSFLIKVRAIEEILKCGAINTLSEYSNKSLLKCGTNQRVQIFNINFNDNKYWQFRRFIIFFAEVADADSPKKVETLLNNLTLPPVSYGLKRNHGGRSLTINSYLGFGYIREDSYRNNDNEYYGIVAPVGLEWTFYKRSQRSLSVMLAPVDLAHPVNLEFKDSDETVTMEDILMPGIYLTYGMKDLPFAVGMGYARGPSLRSTEETTERYVIFIAVDMPLL